MIIKKISFGTVLFVILSSMQMQASNSPEPSYYEIILKPRKFTDYLPDWAVSWKKLTTQNRVRRMYIGTNSYIQRLFKKTWMSWTESDVDKFVRDYSNFINRYKDIIDKPFIVYDSIEDYNKYKDQSKDGRGINLSVSEFKKALDFSKLKVEGFENVEDVWRKSRYGSAAVAGNRDELVSTVPQKIIDYLDGIISPSIQKRLRLPEKASDQMIHNEYIKQIEDYDPENIAKEVKKGELSPKLVSRQIMYGKRLREAYAQYNAQQHAPVQLEPKSLKNCLDLLPRSVGDKEYIRYVRSEYEKFMNNFDPAKLSKLVAKGSLSEEDVVKIRKSAEYLQKMYEKEYGTAE